MLISVIIPAYNVERFIKKTIQSALNQSQVGEVIIIDDGSTDDTLQLVNELLVSTPILKVYQHKDGINKGRGASRNLGIKAATQEYIAFLDADDYYLDNRFANDKLIFEKQPSCVGVYNAIGVHFYRDAAEQEKEKLKLTTINGEVAPAALFETLLFYKKGHFSIDGLTVKRAVFDKVGLFDESLKVGEDTNLLLRMALKCELHAGLIQTPVAMRGVHDNNIFNEPEIYKKYGLKIYESLLFWCLKEGVSIVQVDLVLDFIWRLKFQQKLSIVAYVSYWFKVFFTSPKLLFSRLSIKYFPLIRLRKRLFKLH